MRIAARAGTRITAAASDAGQATILLLGVAMAVLLGALILGAVARGVGVQSDEQRAADLAALAGARAMHHAYPGLFEPAVLGHRTNRLHLERAAYAELGRRAAMTTARRNGAHDIDVTFPDGRTFAPVRIRVEVLDGVDVPSARQRVAAGAGGGRARTAVGHRVRDGRRRVPRSAGDAAGQPMRPDVAAAFDRMAAAAREDGISLIVVSGFRSNTEQALLFARHPDPKWVAPPGKSLHRLATELDLGPAAAYGWLAAKAERYHFIQRYSWEPWHYGFTLNAGTASVGFGDDGDGERTRAMPSFIPARFAAPLARAAQRWNVSAALLGAQLYAESNFSLRPFAVAPARTLEVAPPPRGCW